MDNTKDESKRCETCAKMGKDHRCKVLKKLVGKNETCWAWSGDPFWEMKTNQACEEYLIGRVVPAE